MNIIATNNNNFNHLFQFDFKDLPFENSSVLDYRKNIDTINAHKYDYGINSFLKLVDDIESRFHNSAGRSKRYYSKGKKSRTIITLLGEVTFYRTYYQDRHTGKCFFYVDKCLKLDKYKSLDPYLEAMLLNEVATTSMAGAARNISRLINKHPNDLNINISRQTVRNIVLSSNFNCEHNDVDTPEVLNIMLDEKWLPLQRENQSKVMCKCAVIYEDRKQISKSRTKLINKTVVMSIDKFNDKLLDVLHSKYDMDKVKTINIVGDGANWIKYMPISLKSNNYTINSYLDKFHFNKTINAVARDTEIRKLLIHYVITNDKILLNDTINSIIEHTPNRKEKLTEYLQYLNNNFKNIHNTYKLNIPCSMEGHISHNIASHLARNPKGYKINTLHKLITLREAKLNNTDIITQSLKETKSKSIKYNFDFSMFESKDTYAIANPKFNIS